MSKNTRRTFSHEFRLETAQLVVDQGYTHDEAAKAMGVGFSTVGKWVKQLRSERSGKQVKQMLAGILQLNFLKIFPMG
jgi:transposase